MATKESPEYDFDYHPRIAQFAVPIRAYLAAHPNVSFSKIATHTLVFDSKGASEPRVLLLQRAANDSSPNKWEPPGGACDEEDESILKGAARELWEEAGLKVSHFHGQIEEGYLFSLRNGSLVCRFTFSAEPKTYGGTSLVVKLDPKEHQNFIWATEEEVKTRKAKGKDLELDFTAPEVERIILLGFKRLGGE